jgi:hypothetical protein
MRLRYLGAFDMPLRHRVFKPGDVTTFDMDDAADAALAHKAAGITAFFAPVEDDEPVTLPGTVTTPKRRGRPRKVIQDGKDAG